MPTGAMVQSQLRRSKAGVVQPSLVRILTFAGFMLVAELW